MSHIVDKKYTDGSPVLVRFNPNYSYNELENLLLYDIKSGDKVGEINFSLDIFYFEIYNLFKMVIQKLEVE